ncbi:hypothetical protein PIB30_062489 [Stylosanthes scabra]|uniref:Uncharacterized protein n=1 Tax=Stylosanthes scabra TaxID=79078 RepID=A0ABU6SL88_9FABA|nr:hypothetical protein [Stylosanthes scabra]
MIQKHFEFYEEQWMNPLSGTPKPTLNSKSDQQAEIDEGDAESIQIVTEIVDPNQAEVHHLDLDPATVINNIHQQNSEIPCQIQFQIQKNSKIQQLQSRIRSSNSNSPYIQPPILPIQIQRFLPDAETGDDEEAVALTNGGGNVIDVDDEALCSAEVGASVRGMCTSSSAAGRTTPAMVEDDTMVILGEPAAVEIAEANCTRSLGDGGEQGTTSGAEDGAIAKTGRRISVAFEDGEVMEKKNGATTITNGGLRVRQLRRFFLLNPPPLLAAIFPWDRDGRGSPGLYGAASTAAR